jgi:hypothetical protein
MSNITDNETKNEGAYHELVELVDKAKKKLTDKQYKDIIEKIADIKKKDDNDFYEITYTFPTIERHCADCEAQDKLRCDCEIGGRPHIRLDCFQSFIPQKIVVKLSDDQREYFNERLRGRTYGTLNLRWD